MLTAEQIDELFEFCKKHSVPYYDVQVELVDHLANAVEEQMKNNPKLTFQEALKNVHTSFGVSGFAPLIAEKRKMVERQSRSLFWKLLKEYLHWPKILLFLLIVSIAFTSFTITPYFFQIFYVSIIISSLVIQLSCKIKHSKKISLTGKKFLAVEFWSFPDGFFFLFFFLVPMQIFDSDFATSSHGILLIPYSSIVAGILVITTIVYRQTLTSLNKKLQKDYPEVFGVAE